MKTFTTLTFLLITTVALAQYPVDWRNAPKNPIPKQYTTEHYLIYHNVKSVRYKVGELDWLFTFDENGKSTTLDTGLGITKYSYDSKGHLRAIKDGYTTARFKTNTKGYITQEKYSDGSGSRFEYNENGLYIAKYDLKTGVMTEEYRYDTQNRVIAASFQSTTGAYLGKSTYAYKDIASYLMVTETTTNGNSAPQTVQHHFSKRGEPLSTNYTQDTMTYDAKSNMTSYYNSTEGTTTTFDITYF